jgi:hypothetical protein
MLTCGYCDRRLNYPDNLNAVKRNGIPTLICDDCENSCKHKTARKGYSLYGKFILIMCALITVVSIILFLSSCSASERKPATQFQIDTCATEIVLRVQARQSISRSALEHCYMLDDGEYARASSDALARTIEIERIWSESSS